MFIKTQTFSIGANNYSLTFVPSINIQAYPCGRRRSTEIEKLIDGNSKKYRIPFDPESRLNTEANNRKHSSLNGFNQTYLHKWDARTGDISLALAGYLFDIKLTTNYIATSDEEISTKINAFGEACSKAIGVSSTDKLYVNILLENVHLFSGDFKEYYTEILRDQTNKDGSPQEMLDLCKDQNTSSTDSTHYYFAGLSFSNSPLTGQDKTNSFLPTSRTTTVDGNNVIIGQTLVSLCLLEKVEGIWQIHQPAYLPKITHGETIDSVVMGETTITENLTIDSNTTTDSLNANGATIDELAVNDVANINKLNVGIKTAFENIDISASTIKVHDSIEAPNIIVTNTTKDAKAIIDDAVVTKATIAGIVVTDPEDAVPNITADKIKFDTHAEIKEITTPKATVTDVLDVHNGSYNSQANIDIVTIQTATIANATVTDFNVPYKTSTETSLVNTIINNEGIDTPYIKATSLEADGISIGEEVTASKVVVKVEDSGNTSSITHEVIESTTIKGSTLLQNSKPVPIVDLVEQDGYWQLQISRITVTPESIS